MLNHEEDSEYIMTDDELDHIQWDLEAMLTSLIIRKNTIKDELATFASMQFTRSLHRTAKNPKLPTIVSFVYHVVVDLRFVLVTFQIIKFNQL